MGHIELDATQDQIPRIIIPENADMDRALRRMHYGIQEPIHAMRRRSRIERAIDRILSWLEW